MFRTNCDSNVQQLLERSNPEKRKIRVLSLFDGLATGRCFPFFQSSLLYTSLCLTLLRACFSGLLVLLKLGLAVDVYYASEIDPDALMVSASHFGDRIVPLGNVKDITEKMIGEMAPIDLLIGGSPCNDLSLANPARLGLHGLPPILFPEPTRRYSLASYPPYRPPYPRFRSQRNRRPFLRVPSHPTASEEKEQRASFVLVVRKRRLDAERVQAGD